MRKNGKLEKDLERIIDLKMEIKSLEEELKEVQNRVLALESPPESYSTADGKITLQERKSFSIPSNIPLIKEIGQATFNERAKISASEITAAIGEKGFDLLLKKKIVLKGEPAKYYKLTVF